MEGMCILKLELFGRERGAQPDYVRSELKEQQIANLSLHLELRKKCPGSAKYLLTETFCGTVSLCVVRCSKMMIRSQASIRFLHQCVTEMGP